MDFDSVLLGFSVVLFVWAITNICLSIISRRGKYPAGSISYFYWEMNGLWNIINLAIVLISTTLVLLFRDEIASSPSLQSTIGIIIALNVAFDVGYICFGYWLKSGKKKHKKPPTSRQIGYGKSLIVQGLFLLCFDAVLSQSLFWLT
jgi:hypothetical protein